MYAAAASPSGAALASASASASASSPVPRAARNTAVIYRSSALAATAPALVSAVDSRESARIPAIAKAHALAEEVREKFKKRGRGRTKKDDALTVELADSEEAEKAGRYDRRLKMNRQSAAASRVRREAYIKALEAQLVAEDKRGCELEAQLQAERAAHARLRENLAAGRLLPAPSPPAPPDALQVSESSGVPASDDVSISPLDIQLPASETERVCPEYGTQFADPVANQRAVSPSELLDFVDVPSVTVTAPFAAAALDDGVKYEPQPVVPEEFLTSYQPIPQDEFAGLDFAQAPFPFTEVDPEIPQAGIDELLNLPEGL